MKFGSVEDPGNLDLSLPDDHPDTSKIITRTKSSDGLSVYVGCAKWNRAELKNFYPRGTKDELSYYASRFNAIEFNATFYRYFSPEQVNTWVEKVPDGFRFFPKVNREISHRKWLSNVSGPMESFQESVAHFHKKLGTSFLQLRDNFSPKHFDRVQEFLQQWPEGFPLAVELRHTDWFGDPAISGELYHVMEENRTANVIVDTAGRRDLLHMRLTNDEAFIRFVGANHPTDYTRLDDWTERLESWVDQGLRKIHFFVHQNVEMESPVLASHFIRNLNKKLDTRLTLPVTENSQTDLF